MAFKINISNKQGKTFKLEVEMENLAGKKIGDIISGNELHSDLSGYELKISGLSDKAGIPSLADVEGSNIKRKLLVYGKVMKQRSPRGIRKKKTIRGNTISLDTMQINLKVEKQGEKKLEEIFPDQNKPKEVKTEEPKTEGTQ